MLNFRQIEVFRAIMLTRTMSAAARMLRSSQPGLSRMIKHLEGRLGFLLFDRVHGRLVPDRGSERAVSRDRTSASRHRESWNMS